MKVVYPTNMLPLYLIMNTSTGTIYSSLQRIHMMYSHGRRPRHSPTIILPPLLLSLAQLLTCSWHLVCVF